MAAALCCPPLPRAGRSPLLPFSLRAKRPQGSQGQVDLRTATELLGPRAGTPTQTSFFAANCLLALAVHPQEGQGGGSNMDAPNPASDPQLSCGPWIQKLQEGRMPHPMLDFSPKRLGVVLFLKWPPTSHPATPPLPSIPGPLSGPGHPRLALNTAQNLVPKASSTSQPSTCPAPTCSVPPPDV